MGFFSKNSTTNAAGCCQACGAPLEPDCAFCTACGAPVTAPSAPPMGGGFGTAGVCPVCVRRWNRTVPSARHAAPR